MDDVGMVESGRGSGFTEDARSTVPRVGPLRAEKLERDTPIEFRILGHIHVAHPAASELFQHQVMTESVADEWDQAAHQVSRQPLAEMRTSRTGSVQHRACLCAIHASGTPGTTRARRAS